MNRATRRRKQYGNNRSTPMGQKIEPMLGPMKITHGHSDTYVVMVFNKSVTQLMFTPAEAVALVEAVNEQLRNLAAHQVKLERGN